MPRVLDPKLIALQQQIATGLLAFRQSRGWTRPELLSVLPGVSLPQLQRWEGGLALPRGRDLLRMARLLGLSLDSLPAGALRCAALAKARRLPGREGLAPEPVLDFAALMMAHRLQLGLSKAEIAERWQVPITSYARWESGKLPGAELAPYVARQLALPPSALSTC